MNPKIGRTAPNARKILRAIVSLSLLLHCPNGSAAGQAPQATQPGEIYAGIELTTEWVRAIALSVTRSEEESGLKLIYSENIRLALERSSDGQFTPQAAKEAAQIVLKLLTRLRRQSQAPPERVFLIGSSGLGADRPEGLVKAISEVTGKTITILNVETETQLSVVGTISRLWKVGDAQIDNRNSSALIEINSDSIKGGYQLLRYSPSAPSSYDFVTMSVSYGAMGLAGAESLPQTLRGEREGKPGLVNRKRVYLTGNVAWAVVALVHPENRQTFVPLTYEEIIWFAEKAARAPQQLLNPNLSAIPDPDLRE
jgi:hypothetical protein